MDYKIDVVIPWVDGNDPVLKAKRAQYGDSASLSRPDIGGETRYASLGEIHWCIRSINKFATFVNKIFIVTDGQDPKVESTIPVEIVDHHVIFRNYPEFLPVFNSTSIETLIWNIPGLSEHFLLMNDDFVLIRDVSPEDFFMKDGELKCYCRKKSIEWAEIAYRLSILKYGYPRATFKKMLIKGSISGGCRHSFFHLLHTPRPLLKSVFENYYAEHPEKVVENIRHRFRHLDQYQPQALFYGLLDQRKLLKMDDGSGKLLFIQHWKGADYIQQKLHSAAARDSYKFVCFNSLDSASKKEQELVKEWIGHL